MFHVNEIRQEFRPMLRLAVPLALSEVGWISMGFVDTVMVGRLPYSATAIGAVSLGTTLFYTIALFGSSIMLGLDTIVSQAFGAKKLEECHRALWNALYFSLVLSPLLMLCVLSWLPSWRILDWKPHWWNRRFRSSGPLSGAHCLWCFILCCAGICRPWAW